MMFHSSPQVQSCLQSTERVPAARLPYRVKVTTEKRYAWCACGHSKKQVSSLRRWTQVPCQASFLEILVAAFWLGVAESVIFTWTPSLLCLLVSPCSDSESCRTIRKGRKNRHTLKECTHHVFHSTWAATSKKFINLEFKYDVVKFLMYPTYVSTQTNAARIS